ncbi:MAG TPA: polyphosphate kinase 1 [Ignavibacteria bacterium]|nr:polyphosphate kinase 1 [Ignavibacteria bacterium]
MNISIYFNREISWLSFNYRVLQEAKDKTVPLYERIKFLAIYSSNLDEYYRVRISSLRTLINLKRSEHKKLSFNPEVLLNQINYVIKNQQIEFGNIYRNEIIPLLNKRNIFILDDKNLNKHQKKFLDNYFEEVLKDYCAPTFLVNKKINLFLNNDALYLVVKIKKKNIDGRKHRLKYALIEIPSNHLPRFIFFPQYHGRHNFIFLDDIIRYCLPKLFPNHDIFDSYSIKLTRDAELYIEDEFTGNLLEKIKLGLSKRTTGAPSRFLYDKKMPDDFLQFITDYFRLEKNDLVKGAGYHNFNDFFSLQNPIKRSMVYSPQPPLQSKFILGNRSFFNSIRKKDILLHYPYQSYNYVLNFLNEVATDKKVKEIKITLYRVATDSSVVKSLIKAVQNGKKVTVFVEVKARFDEELNLFWAKEMEEAGVNVLYSFPGLKVHAKLCLIKRIENTKTKYYAYLATGNFNEKTAKIYSDFGFFTSDERLIKDMRKIFWFLSKQENLQITKYLLTAPNGLRLGLEALIDNEIANAKKGMPASIKFKMNNIEDKKMIRKLYKASRAGVKIDMIVRGICCLKPGIINLSENIKVYSIVDRYLEHSRVFIFHNGGDEKIYLASADLMKRNLNRRIEVAFPIYSKSLKKIIKKLFDIQYKDNVKSRIINEFQDNQYKKDDADYKLRSQYETYRYLKGMNS